MATISSEMRRLVDTPTLSSVVPALIPVRIAPTAPFRTADKSVVFDNSMTTVFAAPTGGTSRLRTCSPPV